MRLTNTVLSSHPEVQKFKPTALKLSKAYVSPQTLSEEFS